MISFLKLIRYPNLLMILLTMFLTKYALIDYFVYQETLYHFQFLIIVFSVICITAAGYILNDIVDIEADKINKPNKVFIEKTISKKNAWFAYLLLTFLGFILGSILAYKTNNIILFFLFIFSIIGVFMYSIQLKKRGFIGNLIVSILVSTSIGIVYIFCINNSIQYYVITDIYIDSFTQFSLSYCIITYIIFSFLTTLIREIIKDIEDVDGDLKINAKTLPIVIGRKRANRIALGITVLLLFALVILIREILIEQQLLLTYSILLLLLPIGYFTYKLYSAETKKDYSMLSNLIKLIMLFGILSMLLFKLM